MKDKSDYELMNLVKKKHRPALEELYERYVKLIYSFVFKFTQRNEEKTKEIIQLVFLRLWTTKSTYDTSKGEYVNWLLTITRNICIDYIRKDSKENLNRIWTESLNSDKQFELEDPSNEIEDKINNTEIQEAKNKLSQPQKRLIDLLYWRGYSLNEIAKMENEPLGTVKNRLHQSLKRLRKYLN
ncbi:sigma-70 family RNA polymerase sigma factor [Bacillus sp. DX1.1]|uniref:RNA polymerase sigma factor n=1 Tax=unclassified Bacillus (in: firmicutes) TaxID=185979 RepID=UPI00256FBD35|nr:MULTISPECIES: sigma-70 family RNA polymerase sigma factor [unclassified Bacillus (in: firmicutes)]MDM5153124.1 sigma-70 family RNA polymerase sigma factor [Bacillus sp. DX1.1]MDM5186782.1 sigma-70 family RNA polymerase sigma factor [Bacillus sp. DX4.1]WJE82094.1 sigma-70 family RNA polymerase sigma factor [Bacillus sp. DX3.1]